MPAEKTPVEKAEQKGKKASKKVNKVKKVKKEDEKKDGIKTKEVRDYEESIIGRFGGSY